MIKRQEGFSLIEALIALLVLSVGLIGMAGMQTKALISAQNSYLESVATLAAVDAQERLWARLVKDRDCTTINSSVLTEIREAWIDNWFNADDSPNSPLLRIQTYSLDLEDSEDAEECEFSVSITATEEPLSFNNIRLPDLRDKE
ncbi:type IV pilus modification protein PilV [Halomonas sp. BLK-85]